MGQEIPPKLPLSLGRSGPPSCPCAAPGEPLLDGTDRRRTPDRCFTLSAVYETSIIDLMPMHDLCALQLSLLRETFR